MEDYDAIAATLKARLSELRGRVEGIDRELRTPLSADFEEQAADLENQDALSGVEEAALREIGQIDAALQRIAQGSYGVCANCGNDIAPRRLEALPTATQCIGCAS